MATATSPGCDPDELEFDAHFLSDLQLLGEPGSVKPESAEEGLSKFISEMFSWADPNLHDPQKDWEDEKNISRALRKACQEAFGKAIA
jgi:hypothetical protein